MARYWNWICGLGIVVCLIFLGGAHLEMSKRDTTPGTVTHADQYTVQVQYTVEGRTYHVTGDQVSKMSGTGGAVTGATIDVYYDPTDPADAVLATLDRRKMPAIFLLMFVVFLVLGVIQKHRDRSS
jgi:hypothetical protein